MSVISEVIGKTTRRTKKYAFIALACAILTSSLSVYVNVAFGQLAERVVGLDKNLPDTLSKVLVTMSVILIIYLLTAIIGYFQERSGDLFRFRALNELRIKGYEKIQKLPIDYFSTNRPGTIVQKTTYVASVVNWVADFTYFRIYNIAIPLLSLIPLFSYNIYIGGLTMTGILATIALQVRKTRKRKPHLIAGNDSWDDAVGIFSEHVSHMSTSRTTANQKSLLNIFSKSLDIQLGHRMKQNQVEWTYNSVQLVFEAIIISAVLVLTVYLAYNGKIGIAELVAVTAMIRSIMLNSRGISMLYDSYITASTEGKKFIDLLNEEESKIGRGANEKLIAIESIEINDVSFNYPDDGKIALQNISFRLDKSKRVALVGTSGGGKSTLAKILMRLYEPTSGEIKLNNKDAKNYRLLSTQQQIGVVMQDVALYHTTIAENIRLAKPSASDNEIVAALKLANAWDFIEMLPNGIETVVGERGIKLSGGQRQRIAIARAAVKKPSLIILDEATSALDSTSEGEVQKGLEKLMRGKMAILVAHRLSTTKDCDEILVIEHGSIIERGNHASLIALKGRYAELWTIQSDGTLD